MLGEFQAALERGTGVGGGECQNRNKPPWFCGGSTRAGGE